MNDKTPPAPTALDFKSATLYALRVVLHDHDTDALARALAQRMQDAGAFFENEAVVIDPGTVTGPVDWPALVAALRSHRLHPVGVVADTPQQAEAMAAGLTPVELGAGPTRPATAPATTPPPPLPASPAAAPPAEAPPTASAGAAPAAAPATLVINRPLRSGQRIYARGTDLIVIGVVSQGAEIIADGNIHVYGPLRGKAMAGARGDQEARIFATQLDPELLAIAGVYRVIENRLDEQWRNRPCLVELAQERLNIQSLAD